MSVVGLNLFVCSNVSRADDQDQQKSRDAGKVIYRQNCAVCHGLSGNGKGVGAKELVPPPPDFTRPGFWKDNSHSFLFHIISNGIGQMPAWSEVLTPEQIGNVLAYIKTFSKN
ncbi:MAG: c-type cytochrome [Leptospirales bacterium]